MLTSDVHLMNPRACNSTWPPTSSFLHVEALRKREPLIPPNKHHYQICAPSPLSWSGVEDEPLSIDSDDDGFNDLMSDNGAEKQVIIINIYIYYIYM